MTNEEKILELLAQIQGDIAGLKSDVSYLKTGQAKLESDVSEIKTGQAKMQEDIAEIKTDVKYVWQEIDRFSDRISAQDRIIEKKIM